MIREIIEARAREAATRYWNDPKQGEIARGEKPYDFAPLSSYFQSFAIAILTDPNVGFKEALGHIASIDCDCPDYPGDACTCPCHTASAKLAGLQEMEKGI